MYHRFIALYSKDGIYGEYGIGETQQEAVEKMTKAAKKRKPPKGHRVIKFTSNYPFVPYDEKREPNEDEADAYIGRDGSISWVRCEREDIV